MPPGADGDDFVNDVSCTDNVFVFVTAKGRVFTQFARCVRSCPVVAFVCQCIVCTFVTIIPSVQYDSLGSNVSVLGAGLTSPVTDWTIVYPIRSLQSKVSVSVICLLFLSHCFELPSRLMLRALVTVCACSALWQPLAARCSRVCWTWRAVCTRLEWVETVSWGMGTLQTGNPPVWYRHWRDSPSRLWRQV